MSNWESFSNLLEQEYELWQKLYQENAEWTMTAENMLEEGQSFFAIKENYLEKILQLQSAMELYQKEIEALSEPLSMELQQKIKKTIENIGSLQILLNQQERSNKQYLLQCQTQIKEEIKSYRNKKAVQTGYQSMPLLAESALMDQKN